MNSALMNAILAMDAYNRGYGEGLALPTILHNTKVGSATIVSQSDIINGNAPRNANFYALAYDTNNDGQADIISYRGTDDFANDPITGWGG